MGMENNKYKISTSRKEVQLIDVLKKPINLEALSQMASDIENFNLNYDNLTINDKTLDEDTRRVVAKEFYENLEKKTNTSYTKEIDEIMATIGGKHFYDNILDGMYRIFVNTSFMNQIVDKYNKNYENMSNISRFCTSDPVELNKGKNKVFVKDGVEKKVNVISLNTSTSKDIVTTDFKNIREDFIGLDEKMQKTAFWANQLAHAASDEVKTFTEQFMGAQSSKEESERAADNFSKKIQNAYFKYMDKPEYKFRLNYLSQLVDEKDFDFKKSTDPDFLKAKQLMNDANVKCKDVSFVRNFLHCIEMQQCTEQAFEIKNQAIKSLVLFLNDPQIDDEEKILKMYRVKDNKTKDRKRNNTSRLLILNKTMDRTLLQFNDNRFYSKKAYDNIALELKEKKGDVYTAIESIKTDELIADEHNEINEEKATALSELCGVTSFHVSDVELDSLCEKNDIKLEEKVSPIQYCLAFYGGGVSEVYPNANKTSSLTHFVDDQVKRCDKNKKLAKVNEMKEEEEEINEKARKFADEHSLINKISNKIGGRSK